MLHRLPYYQILRQKSQDLAPGSRVFLKSLSIVSLGFAFSKVFSSIATIIVARLFGPTIFGEASVIMQVSSLLSIAMVLGLNVSLMKFGSSKEDPAPQVATIAFMICTFTAVVAGSLWYFSVPFTRWLSQWLSITPFKFQWAIGIAVLLAIYALFTSAFQALNLYKIRGMVEACVAFLLLPGLLLGYFIHHGNYETVLVAYALAYGLSIPFMVWRFRHMLLPRHLFATDTLPILGYGLFACLSNIGFILTFVVQPLQIEWARGVTEVGIYRVYCSGSITLATFASGIFYTVFFPRVSVSKDRHGIWRKMSAAWLRGAVPLFVVFLIVQVVTILAAGKKYPFLWDQVLLYSLAALIITAQSTYGQIIASQGIRGIRWGLALSLLSGVLNFTISYWLIPKIGLTGAIIAITVNYSVTLIATLLCGKWLMHSGGLADA